MPVSLVSAFVAVGLALLLFGLFTDGPAGSALTSGGLGMIIVTVMMAVASRVRR